MNILFVICGEGLGHASRSIKLARYLTQHGHTCTFASYGKAYTFIQKQKFFVYPINREITLGGNNGLFSLEKTLCLSKTIPISLPHSYYDVRRLLKDYCFDILISDTMYAAGFAAKSLGIPNVFITNQNTFAPLTESNAVYWSYLSRIVQLYLRRVPDIVIVPDFPPPDTISGYNFFFHKSEISHYQFVGPILDRNFDKVSLSAETIFASFGGEPFKLPLYTLLREMADKMPDKTFEVFSTTPGLPESTDNFRTFGYVTDLQPYLAKSRVAIMHGGLTSLMEALSLGKPVVMIIDPYHPEQWNNAKKIEEIGAGITVLGNAITKEKLDDAISRALTLTPPNLHRLFSSFDGSAIILRILEHLNAS
ncbi:MAG TPA: glycosyltransferase [Methanocorpusculum sp.]|nr:glycosyltransferase [Methanocorpusculum sp.]